jgi:hypothetical protein
MKEDVFSKIASWIYNEGDTPIEEIEWLLKVVYTDKEPKLTFEEAWGDVLDEIKRRE